MSVFGDEQFYKDHPGVPFDFGEIAYGTGGTEGETQSFSKNDTRAVRLSYKVQSGFTEQPI